MHDQDPADDRHDVVTRLMAENDKLKTEIARLESECRGWNAETKAGFFRQADYIRKYQEENDRLQEQIAQLRAALEPFAAYAKCFGDGWADSTGTSCLFIQSDGSLAHTPNVNLGHCRRAKEVLEQMGN